MLHRLRNSLIIWLGGVTHLEHIDDERMYREVIQDQKDLLDSALTEKVAAQKALAETQKLLNDAERECSTLKDHLTTNGYNVVDLLAPNLIRMD